MVKDKFAVRAKQQQSPYLTVTVPLVLAIGFSLLPVVTGISKFVLPFTCMPPEHLTDFTIIPDRVMKWPGKVL